jgi:hypothetical protein
MYAGLASLVVGVGLAGALLMSGNKGAKTERANTSPAEVAAKQTSPASASKTTAPPVPAYVKPKPYPQPSPEADRQAVRRPAQPSPPRQAPQPNDSYVRPSTVAGVAGPIVDALRRSDPPAPAPAPVRPSPASPAEQFNPIFPSDFTAGYRLVVFNSRDPKHPIPDGQSFSTKDPLLGEMGSGDLKAQILLKGPPGKGKLSIEWTVDGTIGDGGFVSPNTVAVFRNEPYPGNYRVTLRRDLTVVAEYKFRITP